MLRVISGVVTRKKHSFKNLKISQKPEAGVKISALKSFVNFTGKYLY